MSEIIERIKQIIVFKGLSERAFCKEIGVANGFLSKVSDVGYSKMKKILDRYKDISPLWLLCGDEPMVLGVPSCTKNKFSEKKIQMLPLINDLEFISTQSFDLEEKIYALPHTCKAEFLFEMKGKAMEPRYHNGSVLACVYSSELLLWGRTYIIATNQGVLVARVYKGDREELLKLKFENNQCPSLEIQKESISKMALVVAVVGYE